MKKKILKLIIIMLVLISAAAVLGSTWLFRVNTVKISKNDKDLGIKTDMSSASAGEVQEDDGISGKIINIALFGGDRRYKNDPTRSDAEIILSIDTIHKDIKMSSVMRDTYVDVYNHGKTKITHAYAYGGPQLAIRTLNENFNLDIRNYVFVDFYGLEKLIDTLGGVNIDVKKEEIPFINKCIDEVASIKKTRAHHLTKPGLQNLNGQQAVAYSRIRYVGNGDYERTDRQRRVLSLLLEKVKNAGLARYPAIAASILPYVETSYTMADILKLGTYIFTSNINTIKQARFPEDGYCKGQIINKVWYLVADMDATKNQMHEFIYEDAAQGKTAAE